MAEDDTRDRIRELEDALAASERRNRELLRALEHIPSGVEIYDQHGTAAYLNPAMVTMTGLPSAEAAIGKFNILTDPFSAETGLKPLYEKAYGGEVVETEEFAIEMGRATDDWGTADLQIWFKMVLVPLKGVEEDVEAVFAIMLDTTGKRKMAKVLQRTSKRDGIELMAGGVAHDFNNLLTAIIMNAEFISEEADEAASQSMAKDILSASDQAVFLTRQLLTYTGREEQTIHTLDLVTLTKSICQVFRQTIAQAGSFHLHLPDRPALAEVDAGQYKQVIMNMLTNGLEALPDQEGSLEVTLTQRTLSQEDLGRFQFPEPPTPGTWNVLRIHDNGCGMPDHVRQRVFQPYFTTKTDGHGLGLAATLGIIWNHGGGVAVESAPNKGTTFTVLLPLSRQSVTLAPPPVESSPMPKSGRGLVVDTSPYVRGSLRVLLQKVGWTVEEHRDGNTARDTILSSREPPDLVVMDLMLTPINGMDVLREIRHQHPTLPVLLMGNHEDMGRVGVNDDAHADFILKPFSSEAFLAHAAALLAKRAG